jgi:hypothetical protein
LKNTSKTFSVQLFATTGPFMTASYADRSHTTSLNSSAQLLTMASLTAFCTSNSSMPAPILRGVGEFAVERVRKLDAVEGFKGTEKEKRVLGWHPEDPL